MNNNRLKYFPSNDDNNDNIAPAPIQEIYFPGNIERGVTAVSPPPQQLHVLRNSGPVSQHHIKRKQLISTSTPIVESTTDDYDDDDAATDDKAYKLFLHKQDKNAQYSFDSNVEDTINDLTNTRQEER